MHRTRVTACKANLSAIAQRLLEYRAKHRQLPPVSGVGFFGALIADGVWAATDKNAEKLSCPSVEESFLTPYQDGIPRRDWYIDAAAIGPAHSAYAGRDMKRCPVDFPRCKDEVLVADDNDPEGNHHTSTVVLWGDMTVREFEVEDLVRQGVLEPGSAYVPVGASSPVEVLQRLSIVD
ncbi:MAG: hypothetical protein GY711_27865 [bacterium]|nr:hypothetical protein [bacterium]